MYYTIILMLVSISISRSTSTPLILLHHSAGRPRHLEHIFRPFGPSSPLMLWSRCLPTRGVAKGCLSPPPLRFHTTLTILYSFQDLREEGLCEEVALGLKRLAGEGLASHFVAAGTSDFFEV